MAEEVNITLFALMTVILSVILIIIAVVLTLKAIDNSTIREPSAFNPYCLEAGCAGRGTYVEADGGSGRYMTLNYCTQNAPKPDFREAMTRCSESPNGEEHSFFHSSHPTMEGSRIEIYRTWYNDFFLSKCGDGWLEAPFRDEKEDFSAVVDRCYFA